MYGHGRRLGGREGRMNWEIGVDIYIHYHVENW